jgi:DNA-binding CsgD family transcriptional regulator
VPPLLSFKKYNEVIEIIYQMATEPNALAWLLEFFSKNTYFHGGALTVHDTKTLEPIRRLSTGVLADSQYVSEYEKNDLYRIDLWSQAIAKTNQQAQFVADHQAVSRKELDKTELKSVIDRYDIYSATGAFWSLPNNQTLRISFQKNSVHGLFSEDELSFLNSLAHHIGRAIEINLKFQVNNSHLSLANHLEYSNQCIALISTSARVFNSSAPFQIFIEEQKRIVINTNILQFNNTKIQQHFEILLAQIKNSIQGVEKDLSFIVPSGDDDADYQATLVPIRNSEGEYQILVTISSISIRLTDKFERLLAQTQLTQSELDVIYKLSKNITVADIAKIKNRSVHTIRTQIKSVQNKLNVNTQAAMISKIFQI